MISRTLRTQIAVLLAVIFLSNALAANAAAISLLDWLAHGKGECVTCEAPRSAERSDSVPDDFPATHCHACHVSHHYQVLMARDVAVVSAIAANAEPEFLSRAFSSRLPEAPFKPPRQA